MAATNFHGGWKTPSIAASHALNRFWEHLTSVWVIVAKVLDKIMCVSGCKLELVR